MESKERICYAKEALNLLTRSGFLYNLSEILLLLEEELEKEQSGEAVMYRKQREALCEIMEEYGKSAAFDDTELYDNGRNLFLTGEILYNYRQHNGLTQEITSEEICAVETYSRMENGRQALSMKHYKALEKKLGIGWGYYQCDLEVEDYRLLEIRNMLQYYRGEIAVEEWYEKAVEALELTRPDFKEKVQQYML